eukprot:CAMPEP_0196575358 /NCGR_PEP_ID=MMETSP1081-20130531/4853_1 /TAXON_ID=36882 /ORGANISM="Pyramimonas amylifera, Strain CCMP720" /LENGTH=400 /DNA_ID=CAMNT_0041893635 /DNA_START=33 /DNA_END=1236 /DNA_ORIENTATION=+
MSGPDESLKVVPGISSSPSPSDTPLTSQHPSFLPSEESIPMFLPPPTEEPFSPAVQVPTGDSSVPAPTIEEVLACAYPKWGPFMRPHTIKAKVVPLTPEFVEYLQEDGLFLPKNNKALPTRRELDLDETPWSDEEAEETARVPDFAPLRAEIQAEIDALGGTVAPKLNWTAPKDAIWMSLYGNIMCSNADEAGQLLDYETTEGASLPPPVLVLKKWYDMQPSTEFRCFVRKGEYLGACQRDTTNFYPFLLNMREELEDTLLNFYDDHVATNFPLFNYTYDVHVTKSNKVKILDFNPYGGETLPLLFEWSELEQLASVATVSASTELVSVGVPSPAQHLDFQPELRLIESQQHIRPGLRTSVPLDLYDTSESGALAEFFDKHKAEHEKVKRKPDEPENVSE